MTISENFIANYSVVKSKDLDSQTIEAGKNLFIDSLGNIIASLRTGGNKVLNQNLAKSLNGNNNMTPLYLGMLIHSLDFDDTHYGALIHTGAITVPAALHASFDKKIESLEFSSESNNFSEIDFKELKSNISIESTIQIDKKYIVNKNKSSLIIVNQQRAHQRIIYEKFLQSITLNNYGSQKLLHPVEFDFSPEEISVLNSNKTILNQFGLIFKSKNNQLTISSMPAYVEIENLKNSIEDLIFNLQNEIPKNSFSESDLISKVMAKSLSIKNGTILDLKEQQYLMNALFACKESMICPFNKKTYVKLEYSQIDNMFK